MDCSPPASSVHGIFQARILERISMPSSRGIFSTQGPNRGLPHCRQILYHRATREYRILLSKWNVLACKRHTAYSFLSSQFPITHANHAVPSLLARCQVLCLGKEGQVKLPPPFLWVGDWSRFVLLVARGADFCPGHLSLAVPKNVTGWA